MSAAALRTRLFLLWLGFALASFLLLVLSPASGGLIQPDQVPDGLLALLGLWIPPLTCFSMFWFPENASARVRQFRVDREKVLPAFALPALYLLVVLYLVVEPLYLHTYPSIPSYTESSPTFKTVLARNLTIASMLSPLGIASTIWVTRIPKA